MNKNNWWMSWTALWILGVVGFPSINLGQSTDHPEVREHAADVSEEKYDFSLPGLSREKPEEGRYVEIEGGYMVPYFGKVPGDNILYRMMPIPGGTLMMGSPPEEAGRREDEGPVVKVTVAPGWVGRTEVTWAEYRCYMRLERAFKEFRDLGVRRVDEESQVDAVSAPSMLYDPSFVYGYGEGKRQPCAMMTQFAAKQYTKFLSLSTGRFYRLPTEAEWEYACRAGTTTAYYFGDDPKQLSEHAWIYENSDDTRHQVARFEPNPWGLHDMYGNVAEWVLDQYVADHYQKLDPMGVSSQAAWAVPSQVYPRVCRGGSFELEPEDCRSSARMFSSETWKADDPEFPSSPWWYTSDRSAGVGFRLFRPLETPKSRESKELYWNADVEEIADAARHHIDDCGKGAYGVVDLQLDKAIRDLKSDSSRQK